MEKKESTTSGHVGMCEKLFNVFNPASRSHHLLTLHGHEPEATINIPSATKPNHSLDSGIKEPGPQKTLPTPVKPRPPAPDQKKPSEANAPKAEPKPTTPPPPPPPSSVPVEKVPDKVVLTSARPKTRQYHNQHHQKDWRLHNQCHSQYRHRGQRRWRQQKGRRRILMRKWRIISNARRKG